MLYEQDEKLLLGMDRESVAFLCISRAAIVNITPENSWV